MSQSSQELVAVCRREKRDDTPFGVFRVLHDDGYGLYGSRRCKTGLLFRVRFVFRFSFLLLLLMVDNPRKESSVVKDDGGATSNVERD